MITKVFPNGVKLKLLYCPRGTKAEDMPPYGMASSSENEALYRIYQSAFYKFADNLPWVQHCRLLTATKDRTAQDWYIWVDDDYDWPGSGPIHNEYGEVAP